MQKDSADFLQTPEKASNLNTPRITELVCSFLISLPNYVSLIPYIQLTTMQAPSQESATTSESPAAEASGGWMDIIKNHVVNVGSTVVNAGSAVTSGIVGQHVRSCQ